MYDVQFGMYDVQLVGCWSYMVMALSMKYVPVDWWENPIERFLEGKVKQNVILDMSFAFAVRIVKLSRFLANDKKEYVLSRQVLRSGTSIGANVKEAVVAQSRKDFIAKLNISLKEANETEYWLQLLSATGYLDDVDSILEDNRSIIRVLTSIIKSTNNNSPK